MCAGVWEQRSAKGKREKANNSANRRKQNLLIELARKCAAVGVGADSPERRTAAIGDAAAQQTEEGLAEFEAKSKERQLKALHNKTRKLGLKVVAA